MERLTELDGQRLGRALSPTPDGGHIAVECVDGRVRSWPVRPDTVWRANDIVALGGDNYARAYVRAVDGSLPREAVDTQIFAEVRTRGQITGLQPHGEQLRINARNELTARYLAQSRARAFELVAAGVLHVGHDGRAGFQEHWKSAYVRERQLAGVSPLGEAPLGSRVQGVVREVGVLTRQGQRGIALETARGAVTVPSMMSRIGAGQAVAFEREAAGSWTMQALGPETTKRVLEDVKRAYQDLQRYQRELDQELHGKRRKARKAKEQTPPAPGEAFER